MILCLTGGTLCPGGKAILRRLVLWSFCASTSPTLDVDSLLGLSTVCRRGTTRAMRECEKQFAGGLSVPRLRGLPLVAIA